MFSYFIPQSAVEKHAAATTLIGLNAAMLERMKIGYVGNVVAKQINLGPSGNAGWLLYREVPGACDSYKPDSQVWQSMAFPADYFIGYQRDAGLPRPTSLARETMLPGHPVRLGDGNQWNIPCAVEFDDAGMMDCRLPRTLQVTESGDWTLGEVVPRYRSLWTTLGEFLDAYHASSNTRFNFPKATQWCADALSTNYYVGPSEVSLLALLNVETRSKVIEAIQDLPTYFELQKKSRANATGDTSSGLDASITGNPATTGQPMPTG